MLKITFLGTGTSHGVPVIGCDCPTCTSTDPRNHRTRCSILVEQNGASVLVDTSPELRLQAIRAGLKRVDAVLFTHAHADHVFGLDDVRRFNDLQGGALPCYGDSTTLRELRRIFRYAFVPTQVGGGKPRLELRLADGSTWYLAGKPTDQTLYGGKPERIFLEVAPQRVACSHPLMPNHQCLQVRTVQYADNGTKTSVGEWGPFYDEIKGYQHEAGVRNVLRVNRYERKNVPADASRYVYVLDMKVESEIAR